MEASPCLLHISLYHCENGSHCHIVFDTSIERPNSLQAAARDLPPSPFNTETSTKISMAAAYAALVSLSNNLEDIQNHRRHSFSFDNNQIQSLRRSVNLLIEFMESYDYRHGEAAQRLERRITRAAHAAEEVIESHVVDQIRAGSTLRGDKRSRFLLDLQKAIDRMDSVRRKAVKVKVQSGGFKAEQPTYSAATPLNYSEKNSMVGFDDVLLQLLDLLTGEPSSRRVIPIVGIGGIGKTTLAKHAFEHPLIAQHFDVCFWATISQQYVVEDVLLKLVSPQGKSNSQTVGELGEQLHKQLYGRRYLAVLDDIWDVEAWDEMMPFFPDTSNGSRIVVTTRQSNVADHIGSSRIEINFLDNDKSWNLFCLKAFAGQGCPPELEDIGKKIATKCKGLPLVIIVVAGHLGKSPRTQEYWENVGNKTNSILDSEENKQLFNILYFSYSHLPVHLKPCFVSMGMFSEDERISVSDLVKRWISEGVLKWCEGDNLEEKAKDYLKDLIDRNLILVNTRNSIVETDFVEIHDLLRELCINIAEKEMFFYVINGTPRAIYRDRRHTPLVRSLKWKYCEQMFDLRLLRVLDKQDFVSIDEDDVEGFLETDLQQLNLRYINYKGFHLKFKRDRILYLTSSISLLWNLQTLIIKELSASIIAPYEIWEMLNLRNLEVCTGIHLLDPVPGHEMVMQNLQTLSNVDNLKLSEGVCKRVPNIKKLEATYSDHFMGLQCDDVRSHYCLHNLGYFHKLESLDCVFGPRRSNLLAIAFTTSQRNAWRKLALSLTLPSSLKELSLTGCCLDWQEMTAMVGSLPHLQSLQLYKQSVIGSEWTLVEGKFLRLKSLNILDCYELVYWNADNSSFPVLENLVLTHLFRLDGIPSCIEDIPTLQSITLGGGCSLSSAISAARIVSEQEKQGNESLELQVLFYDWEKEEVVEKIEIFNKKVEEEGLKTNKFRVSLY